jgi:RNA polymerase sigma-70 factor (ECF subfamily)
MTFALIAISTPSIIVRSTDCYSEADEQRNVFESHRHHIFSVAYYMTGDEREAETILSSTFIQAFQQQPKPSTESSPKPSIDRLDQVLIDELHRRSPLVPVPAIEADGASLGGKNVRRTDLEEVVWQLPARERLCFLLRDVEGYAPDRIAGLLETSEAEIQRTVLSARLRIRSLLIEQRSTMDA